MLAPTSAIASFPAGTSWRSSSTSASGSSPSARTSTSDQAPRGRTRGALPSRSAGPAPLREVGTYLLQPLDPRRDVDVQASAASVPAAGSWTTMIDSVAAQTDARFSSETSTPSAPAASASRAASALSTPTMTEIPSPSEIAWLSRRFVMSSESRPASSPFRRSPVHTSCARYDRIGEEAEAT